MSVPNKSDYYRHNDPVTLAPKTVNPWRNPMKTGIVSPAYNAAATVNYKYGHRNASSANPTNWLEWSAVDGAIGNASGAHMVMLNRWRVQPGVRTINSVYVKGDFFENAYATSTYIEVWRINGANYERVAISADLTNMAENPAKNWLADISSTPLSVTIESGYVYYYGVRVVRTDASAGVPWGAKTADTNFTDDSVVIAAAAAYDLSTGVPTAGTDGIVITAGNYLIGMEIDYNSQNYLEQQITSGTVGKFVVPRAQGVPWVCQLLSVAVADGQALTCLLENLGSGDWATDTLATMELDCGNTVAGQNDIIFGGNTVNLPDINPGDGSAGQEGKTFDLLLGFRLGDTNNCDLYWQCRHLESAVHSHAVASEASNTRGTKYTVAAPSHITLSGTATVTEIKVGTKAVVIATDSQGITGSVSARRSRYPNRIGGFPTELSKPRIWILHGEAGMTSENMRSTIFENATGGAGDGIELLGLDCIWYIAIGLNDISAAITTSEALGAMAAGLVAENICYFVSKIVGAGDEVLLLGLPPYSAVAADEYEAKAVRWLNRACLGIALGMRVPFYNPWLDMVQKGTEQDDIPTFLAAYTEDTGTHYSEAGGDIVEANAVLAYERATIDLRDAWQ